MIGPAEIREKAERLYRLCIQAWLAGDESFFPRPLRVDLRPDDSNVAATAEAVQQLRAASKESTGYGFTIEWQEIRSRTFGRNQFPRRIVFSNREDLLLYLGKSREFSVLANAVSRVRSDFPELDAWIRSNPTTMLEIAKKLDGLIEVVSYLRANPRPQRFARELPLSVDTKFIEENEHVLRAWLDRVLPPHTIAADEEHFSRRFGLHYAEPHVLIRLLDPALRCEAGFPCDELSLPIRELRKLPLQNVRVMVVENKVPLLTLPAMSRAVALGGLGTAVTLFRGAEFLRSADIIYWGDLDVFGFAILSALRAIYPQACSLFMDEGALCAWRELSIRWSGKSPELPPHLTAVEQAAFAICRDKGLRLEQERIPQAAVIGAVAGLR